MAISNASAIGGTSNRIPSGNAAAITVAIAPNAMVNARIDKAVSIVMADLLADSRRYQHRAWQEHQCGLVRLAPESNGRRNRQHDGKSQCHDRRDDRGPCRAFAKRDIRLAQEAHLNGQQRQQADGRGQMCEPR